MQSIVLPKMTTPNRPLNIACDPRVFRGSVIAKQREALKQIQEDMDSQDAEERWRASVVKNKLSLALGAASLMGGGHLSPQEIPLGYRIARLNGPIGQRAIDMTMTNGVLPSIGSPRSIDAKNIPTTIGDAARRRQGTATSHPSDTARSDLKARLKHSASAGSLLPELKAKDGDFMVDTLQGPKNVRFLPPRVRAARHPRTINKFMPLSGKTDQTPSTLPSTTQYDPRFPKRGIAGDRGVSSRRFGQVGTFKQKGMLSRADQGIPTSLGSNTQLFARHTKQWNDLPEIANPPPTAMGPLYWANQGCQTDDLLVFDETFEPLIREMVNGAIIDAQRSLLEDEELKRIEEQNKELLKIVVSEKQKNTELIQNIQQQTVVQQNLEAEKRSTEYILDALEYRKVSSEVMAELTEHCLNRLMDRAIIQDDKFKKDVAADTRQLEQESKHMQRIMDEVERDFFPYVYQKAERVFVHTLADSFLKDALFSKNDQFREDAKGKLNEKIAEYNRILKRTRPGQQTKALKRMLSRASDTPSMKILEEIF